MRAAAPTTRALAGCLLLGAAVLGAGGLGAGCAKATTRPLQPAAGKTMLGDLSLLADASVAQKPATGWDLDVDFTLTWRGQSPARIDLSRTMVRVNELAWRNCRLAEDVDTSTLIRSLEPGEVYQVDLHCRDIPRPGQSVELRIFTSGTGASGVTTLRFEGID